MKFAVLAALAVAVFSMFTAFSNHINFHARTAGVILPSASSMQILRDRIFQESTGVELAGVDLKVCLQGFRDVTNQHCPDNVI